MQTVLITGINGFTGRYVAEELEAHGWRACGIAMGAATDDARTHRVDLLDADGLRRVVAETQPDAVIHLAAIASVDHGNANEFYQVNLIGTRNLLAALASNSKCPGCVILASSANVYGSTVSGSLDEQAPANPANDYAVSKLAMEYMARLWRDELPIVIVRPFNYTGVGQSEAFLVPKIVAHFRRRAAQVELGNLDVHRDFSDVRSVAKVYRRLLEECPAGETFNVSSGQTHSLHEVVSMAEEITGHSIQVSVNPAFVRANEVKMLRGDSSKLQALIGEWGNLPLRETLRWMLA
jgi:GDP-6-deoxy-D-talose 4-dehydrogenase